MTTTRAARAPTEQPPPAARHPRPRVRRMCYEPDSADSTTPPAAPLPAPVLPVDDPETEAERADAHRGVTRILRIAMEVFDGRRLPAHLTPYCTPPALRYWRAATARRRARSPARFRRIRMCLPRSGVAEVAVTCQIDGRVRALAARFERTDDAPGGWQCCAIRLG